MVAQLAPKDRILNTARAVVAMDREATVDDFARAAGVSRTTFYRAFGSRDELLEALELAPRPGARDRILRVGMGMVGEHGATALSMDDLAVRAKVSRATLYRLFPGKTALFKALIETFSPMDPVMQVLDTMASQPPEVVMPEVARAVYRTIFANGENRIGVMRAIFFEISGLAPDVEQAARETIGKLVVTLLMYVQEQMSQGKLRTMHPLLALQAFIGPIFFHLLTRPAVERVLQIDINGEQAVTELAETWLRAMNPRGGT